MKHLVIIFVAALFNSCIVFHSGSVSSGPLLNTKDKYTDIAFGSSRSVFVLGFGNMKKTKLILDAKKDLYFKRPLQKNEYYSNFAVDIDKKIFLGIAGSINVTVSADILIAGNTDSIVFEEAFYKKISPEIKNEINEAKSQLPYKASVAIGDSVYYSSSGNIYNLYVASTIDKETVILNATNSKQKTLLVFLQNKFFVRGNVNGFKSGNMVNAEVLDIYNSPHVEYGELCGFFENEALVKTANGFIVVSTLKLKK